MQPNAADTSPSLSTHPDFSPLWKRDDVMTRFREGGEGDPCFPNTKKEKEKKKEEEKKKKKKKDLPQNTKPGKGNETETPDWILPSPVHGRRTESVRSQLRLHCCCVLSVLASDDSWW